MSEGADRFEEMSLEELRAEAEAAGIPLARALARHALQRSLRERAAARPGSEPAAPPPPAPERASEPAPAAEAEAGLSVRELSLRELWAQARTFARALLSPAGPEPRPRPLPPPGASAPEDAEPEPIRTKALATLLARQGHHRRALGILRHLVEQGSEDPSVLAEAERLGALVRGEELERAHARAFPPGSAGLALRAVEGHLAALYRVDGTRLEGAEALLEPGARGAARPTLRVVRLSSGPDGAPRIETRDLPVEGFAGALSLGPLPSLFEGAPEGLGEPGVRVIVSIGLLASRPEGPRFISMAHASAP